MLKVLQVDDDWINVGNVIRIGSAPVTGDTRIYFVDGSTLDTTEDKQKLIMRLESKASIDAD